MSTSTQLGEVQGLPTSAAGISAMAARTSTFRDLANNLNHFADERSRVLVSFPQRSTTAGGLVIKGGAVNTWQRLYSWGPFPILVGHDGLPYPIRARVGGRSDGAATSYLRIGACLLGRADVEMAETTPGANVISTASFTSATNAWRDPTVAKVTLVPDSAFFPRALPIVDGVSSADPASVAAVLATIEVWGYSSVAGAVVCTQAYAAEQVPLYT